MADEEWTDENLRKMLSNPIYMGLGPYDRVTEPEQWKAANVKLIGEIGPEAYVDQLVENLLEHLGPSPDRDKPVMKLTDDERAHMWDDLAGPLDAKLLANARKEGKHVGLVFAVLVLPDGDQRIVHHNGEYGDDEGWSTMLSFVAQVQRSGSLRVGEALKVVFCSVDFVERLLPHVTRDAIVPIED